MVTAPSRRERLRDATTAEIKATARTLLVRDGPESLTLRAIAREMGMTAPALYRYFDSHERVLEALCGDILADITTALEVGRDSAGSEDPIDRLMATCRAFRAWSLSHPREFQLTFASAQDYHQHSGQGPAGDDLSFGAVFLDLFGEIWAAAPFPVPSAAELPPRFVRQLEHFAAATGVALPVGALAAYLDGWVRLYGAVTIEVFGHLGFALDEPEPMFEAMLGEMRRLLAPAVS